MDVTSALLGIGFGFGLIALGFLYNIWQTLMGIYHRLSIPSCNCESLNCQCQEISKNVAGVYSEIRRIRRGEMADEVTK